MIVDRQKLQQTESRNLGVTRPLPGDWVLWWYGGMQRNHRVKTLPRVVVWFRKLHRDGSLGEFKRFDVGIVELAVLQIGTVWINGDCNSRVPLEEREFTVNFSDHGWQYSSQAQSHGLGLGIGLIPQNLYKLQHGNRDRSGLLVFKEGGTRKLIVPCLEFFSRCYGRSAEVNRIICTYPWSEAERRLYLPPPVPVPNSHWAISLPANLYNDDALFVAHVKYDDFAQITVKGIYSSLESKFTQGDQLAFPQIGPWFAGQAKLIAQGISTGDGTFLALRIAGCSEPQGPPIVCFRDGSTEADNQDTDEASGSTGSAMFRRFNADAARFCNITSTDPAGHPGASIEIFSPSIRIVGTRRKIIHERLQSENLEQRSLISGHESERYSSGEREGTDGTTGGVSIRTRSELESHGAARDVWGSLLYLRDTYPEVIKFVGWYNILTHEVHTSDEEPCMFTLPPYDGRKQYGSVRSNKAWIYADADHSRIRGVLVAFVKTPTRPVYIFEVERRRTTGVDENGLPCDAEKPHSGLIVSPPAEIETADWIPQVLVAIRDRAGIMARVASQLSPDFGADFFRHTTSKMDQVAGHSAVVNALGKVGIAVPMA